MNTKRPIHINPLRVRLPITALVSITHRLSGVLVFLLIPLLLWVLQQSLASPEGLAEIKTWLQSPLCQFALWLFFAGLIFHLFAGIRHLLMDIHLGDSLFAGRVSAVLVIVLSVIVIIVTYWWRGQA